MGTVNNLLDILPGRRPDEALQAVMTQRLGLLYQAAGNVATHELAEFGTNAAMQDVKLPA